MGDILAMAKADEMIILTSSLLLVVAAIMVPLVFFWGWLSINPEVGYGTLGTKSKSRQPKRQWAKARFTPQAGNQDNEKGQKKLKPRSIKVLAKLAEDLAACGDQLISGAFVVIDGRLCAFDNGSRVFYRHNDMLKTALGARVGLVYWLPVIALPCLATLPVLMKYADTPQNFNILPQLYPELAIAGIFALYTLLSIIFWRSLAWLRANAIIRRVEKSLAGLDIMRNRRTPPLEKNPLSYTGLAAFMVILTVGGGLVFWLQYIAPALGWLPGLVPLW